MMPLPASPTASSVSSTTTPPPATMAGPHSHSPARPPPTNARGTPRRPPKLRSSCDACGAAKVRCDKTQPRCARCAAGGLTCVYGLSRKFGKAPRKKPPVDTNISTETLPRPLAQNAQQSSLPAYPDMRHLSSVPRSLKFEPTSVPAYGLDDSLMVLNGGYPTQDMFLRSPASIETFEDAFSFSDPPSATLGPDPRATVDPLDLTFPSSDFQSFAEWVHPDELMHSPEALEHDCVPSLSSSRTPSMDSYQGLADGSLVAADSHSCHRLANSTLESLSFRPEDQPINGEPLTQTMDNVLNRNKQAVNNMHQLLKCSCSKSPHLAMLYASITSKILVWYQLAAGCTKPALAWDYSAAASSQPTPPLSASSSPSMTFVQPGSPIAAQPGHVLVTPMQFSVGAFSVDDQSAQEALRKQLLLSELKKAGNLIDLLCVQGRDEIATGEVNDIYSALGTWLKCELHRTIAALKS